MSFKYYHVPSLIVLISVLSSFSIWLLSKIDFDFLPLNFFLQGTGVSAVVGGFFYLYNSHLWKVRGFKLFNKMPLIEGSYFGKIGYHYNNVDSEKDCRLQIKQTCSHIDVECVFSKEGERDTISISKEAFIEESKTGKPKLVFNYQNKGSQVAGDTLDQHDGFTELRITREEGRVILKGGYYTSRATKGVMDVSTQTERENEYASIIR